MLSESSLMGGNVALSTDHIREVCNLIRSPSPSSKLHAIDILNNVSNYENLVACDEWPVLEEWIRSLLLHPSTVIKRETLRLFWTMLSSGGVVFEHTYTSLLLAARDQVCKHNSSAPSSKPHGRSAGPVDVVELLNVYHRNLPRQWLRFPRKAIRHVIEQALALMDDSIYDNFSRIWKSFASADTQAAWLGSWLHGAESRAVVFECLADHTNILLHALQLVTNYKKFPDFNKKEDFEAVLADNGISAAGFSDIIDFEDSDKDNILPSTRSLTAEQKHGVQLTVECGLHLGLLSRDSEDHAKNLEKLIHNGRHFYGSSCSKDSYDFLLATIFLLLRGNVIKSSQLHKFLCDRDCYALYFHDMDGICDTLVCASFCQLFVVILRDQLPRLYHAFKMYSYEPSNVLKHWIGQFFWGCLCFDEVAAVLLMVITLGAETLLYVCLSMLKHVEEQALQAANEFRFIAMLRETEMHDFKLASYVEFINSLLEEYGSMVQKSLYMYAH
ncbi:hypothetical protein HPB49_017311 [Dermacentor silvarum]|uniref:Uncharacterized protein n=1 Tax=Dermacentor silvarum TaxID=543639 RepID=A0ACB8D717_DERSI|nr:hypothetical protein HPB49_017311 [Dermacentor silvarum]